MHDGINERFGLRVYVDDLSFKNEDNPYGTFVMHQYTNMDDKNDTSGETSGFQDVEIPLKICDGKELDWRGTPNYYCPDFDNSHFIHGGFYSDKFSWMRLALHICDSRPEAKIKRISEGKTYTDCANEVESKNYFEG